jgi:preprotein translocase subunit SecE
MCSRYQIQLIAPAGKRPHFDPAIVKWYFEYKYKEMLATKKNLIAKKHHRAIPIYTPETLKTFVEAKKQEEELKELIKENTSDLTKGIKHKKIQSFIIIIIIIIIITIIIIIISFIFHCSCCLNSESIYMSFSSLEWCIKR